MKSSKSVIIQISLLLSMLIFFTAFACRNNQAEENAAVQAEMQAVEIEAIENEAMALDSAKIEIEEAAAVLDALLNELN